MRQSEHETPARCGSFQIGGWLVQPDLNRICHQGRTVQLEPKLMDVLVFLAERAPEVVSKDELIDGVWKTEFITEWAITRAIAKLRRALGDEAGNPRYIETISKRGYRLIATPKPVAPDPGPALVDPYQPGRISGGGRLGPFIVGQWVRGERFYGREAQIAEILDGNRDCLWVLGTRVSGKTSLLKQLEHVAAAEPERSYLPIYWDLQGAEEPADLDADFRDALVESRARLEAAGIDASWLAAGDLFTTLGGLRRQLAERGLKLLLLCDEAEELLGLGGQAPSLLRKLRRALQSREGIRTVLAASCRLWALAEPRDDTSPFLHSFTPPIYLGPLTDCEARLLIRQGQLDPETRPRFAEDAVERIREVCGNHPYLIQVLCTRFLECGELNAAIADVEADPSVSHLFGVDLALLSETEASLLRALATPGEEASWLEPRYAGCLLQLERLGLVRRTGELCVVGNHFLSRWLCAVFSV